MLMVSALCSLLEAMILSTTIGEIKKLKTNYPIQGNLLEDFKLNIEKTSSAILALNTIVNTIGAITIGGLVTQFLDENHTIYFSSAMTIVILIFAEILPKNIGILYRPMLQKHLTFPLKIVCCFMMPISSVCRYLIYIFLPRKDSEVNKDTKNDFYGIGKNKNLSAEYDEAVQVDKPAMNRILVADILIPKNIVISINYFASTEYVLKLMMDIKFSRLPVYQGTVGNIVGVIHRQDILLSKNKKYSKSYIGLLMRKALFMPDYIDLPTLLDEFLKQKQQLAIVINQFGIMSGVITIKDTFKYLLKQ